MARLDPHSYADDTQPQTETLELSARVDFATKTLVATATLRFREAGERGVPGIAGPLDLDTRSLTVDTVTDLEGRALPFRLHPAEPILGSRLGIDLPAGARGVKVAYRTSPEASALQWLDAQQTLGGKSPFLFSQCQAIHARSVVPLQDSPRVRIRYRAQLTVPGHLRSVMAAAFIGRRIQGSEAIDSFEMPQPIPPYLFAFAVGDLESRELGPRSKVWAEPGQVEAAAHEFAGVNAMLTAAEELFGPYDWDRFDILTMPPSFPYGGMENPRLTFLTPTLIAGDRSLVSVVAHELAHSWTGNLVTNANAEHFWLNEGFTVFAERRILEALEGTEIAALSAALGRRSLDESLARFDKQPALTKLRTHLSGIDPDESFSQVPYEKGYLFLRAIEESVGRQSFNRFLRSYLTTFRFQSVTTDDFLRLCEAELPGTLARVNAEAWLDGPGVPPNAPRLGSARLDEVERAAAAGVPTETEASHWIPTEWQLYLEAVRRPAPEATCAALDGRFHLTKSNNYEVLVAWLTLAAQSGYAPALSRTEEVLGKVGRMKYLRPLYQALAARPLTQKLARSCFERYCMAYHPIARQVIDGVLRQAGA